jgi:beta-lactamase superfamily II metal-dependent hydrolase
MFTFTIFDVGHGFCAYATTPTGANMLFDCGYDHELQFYPSRYFEDRNITYINQLFLSHFDQDHVCDLPKLRQNITFGSLSRNKSVGSDFIRDEKKEFGAVSGAIENAIDMHERYIYPMSSPHDFGGVKIRTFYNDYPLFTDTNNLSLVTFLEYDGMGIVIPGDLECAGWEALLKNPSFTDCLTRTTFFIASHHGRNKGYCERVFDYCKPELVILSDKNVIHDSQDHDYAKHAKGIPDTSGGSRYVLTTRNDGHIRIDKELGKGAMVNYNATL